MQNGIDLPHFEELEQVRQYFLKHTNGIIDIQFDAMKIDLPPRFYNVIVGNYSGSNTFTTPILTPETRNLAIQRYVPDGSYHVVIHAVKVPDGTFVDGITERFITNPGAVSMQLFIDNSWAKGKTMRTISHELIHSLWVLAAVHLNLPFSLDTMDTYKFDDVIEHPEGNRMENLGRLSLYLPALYAKISDRPTLYRMGLITQAIYWAKKVLEFLQYQNVKT